MARLNPALKDFWLTKADIKVLKGGRNSSKSWDTAGMCVYLASKYKVKFLCHKAVSRTGLKILFMRF